MSEVCARCKAPVVWAETAANGKPIPLDPEPVDDGNIALHKRRVGIPVATVLGRRQLDALRGQAVRFGPPLVLYRSHFASCPFADEFRRRK